jgi:uncharacterized membrane protein
MDINYDDLVPLAVYAILSSAISYFLGNKDHTLTGLLRSIMAAIVAGPTIGVYMGSEGATDAKIFVAIILAGVFADSGITGLLKIAAKFKSDPQATVKEIAHDIGEIRRGAPGDE